jgi:hypothetical protein
LVAGGGFDGFFQVAAYPGFCYVGADAGLGGVAGQVQGFEVGDDQDFGVGGFAADDFGGGEAVHGGHRDVEEDYVGLQLGGFFHGVLAVFGFAADGPILVILQEQFQAGAYRGAVVCNQYANCFHLPMHLVRVVQNYQYSISRTTKCTSGVLCSTCGDGRKGEGGALPAAGRLRPRLRGPFATDLRTSRRAASDEKCTEFVRAEAGGRV